MIHNLPHQKPSPTILKNKKKTQSISNRNKLDHTDTSLENKLNTRKNDESKSSLDEIVLLLTLSLLLEESDVDPMILAIVLFLFVDD